MNSSKPALKIISLGLGVQSTTMYYMSTLGIMPRADYAIFADPGAEDPETYKYLKFLKDWASRNNGIKIIHDTSKNMKEDLLNKENSTGQRFASIPLYTLNEDGSKGMLRRQCTNEYKIQVVNKNIRMLHGLAPRQRTPQTEVWIGITLDEVERMRDSDRKWKIIKYPFLDLNFLPKLYTRYDCIQWLIGHGLPVPPKSACVYCPFQGDGRLLQKKIHRPDEWQVIVTVDHTVRDSTKKGIKKQAFLHSTCMPIEDVYLKEDQEELFTNECGGNCGI